MVTPRNRAHEYFHTHVVPAMSDWRSNPDDIRFAMNAAVALNQMADHFWHGFVSNDAARVFSAPNVKTFRNELAKKNNDWGLVRDVAEAHKHVILERPSRHVTSTGQTTVVPMGWGTSTYGTGPYGGTPSVVVTLDNGSKVHFSAVANRVFEMWQSLLA